MIMNCVNMVKLNTKETFRDTLKNKEAMDYDFICFRCLDIFSIFISFFKNSTALLTSLQDNDSL